MIKIKQVDDTNPILEDLVYLTKQTIKEDSGLYYEVIYDGKIRYLNRNGMDFVLYTFIDEEVEYEIFSLDENYQVESIFLEHHRAVLEKNSFWFMDKNNNPSRLQVLERPDGVDMNGYNGILSYTQCNTKRNESFTMNFSYSYNKNNTNKIFPMNYSVPLVLLFKQKKHTKSYILSKIEIGNYVYEVIALKEYGLKKYLQNGSYVLEKEDTLYRYTRDFGKQFENTSLIRNYYKLEDLLEKAKEKGYNTSIPEEIISFYNDFNMDNISDYCTIANAFKEIDNMVEPAILEIKS